MQWKAVKIHHTGLQQLHYLFCGEKERSFDEEGIKACSFLFKAWTAVALKTISSLPSLAAVCSIDVFGFLHNITFSLACYN